jgi:hypothetical protein
MRVTVLVPDWFVRLPALPSRGLANAMTRLPPNSSCPKTERAGHETGHGIVRAYGIHPVLAASIPLAGATINVTYAESPAAPVVAEVAVPEVVFRGAVATAPNRSNPVSPGPASSRSPRSTARPTVSRFAAPWRSDIAQKARDYPGTSRDRSRPG